MGGLNGKLRARWDALIGTEGKTLGLSECRPFLENKMVNDIFYEGKFKGRDCIVKCSTKAPDSIVSEYRMLKRLHASRHELFPEPFCCHTSPDGKMAFIAIEKINDTGFTDASSALDDILLIAKTLRNEGIVHRDVYRGNIFFAPDGHLKLFDFQFAIDRMHPEIPKWLQHNWKYHFVVFARIAGQRPASWNDITAFRRFIRHMFPDAPDFKAADDRLAEMEADGVCRLDIPKRHLPAMAAYFISLHLQRLFSAKDSHKAVIRKRLRITRELIHAILTRNP